VAILFGNERTGLENEQLQLCHTLLSIPTGTLYTSLNLAMAVQVVAYEVCLALRGRKSADSEDPHPHPLPHSRERGHEPLPLSWERGQEGVPLASATDMEKFYAHLEQVLDEIDFRDRTNSGHLMARLRRLFQRTVLDQNEMNILRGILTAVQGKRRRAGEPHVTKQGTAS
jgi:TrmH family RNA methyltransferase